MEFVFNNCFSKLFLAFGGETQLLWRYLAPTGRLVRYNLCAKQRLSLHCGAHFLLSATELSFSLSQ